MFVKRGAYVSLSPRSTWPTTSHGSNEPPAIYEAVARSLLFLSFHSQSGYTGKKESEKFYSINVSARFIIWYVTIRYQLESSVKRVTDHHTLEWTAIPWRNFVVKR